MFRFDETNGICHLIVETFVLKLRITNKYRYMYVHKYIHNLNIQFNSNYTY